MIKNYALKAGILFFVCFVIFGCALSLPQPYLTEPTQMKDQIANYQVPKLPEDRKAIVYIVRPSPYDPSGFNVFLDTQEPNSEMGCTMPKQYIYFDLTPGEHKIFSKAENWAEMNVLVKEGDIIFIQQEPTMGVIRTKNKLLTLQDYEGKYYVKTLNRGTFSSNNQQSLQTVTTQARMEQSGKADTYKGIVTLQSFFKGFGFSWSNINLMLEVTADNGNKDIFYIRPDSKVVDANGNQMDWKNLSFRDKKVEIEYFIITDSKGGDPSSSNDFSKQIGKKGARLMRLLN